METLKLQNFMGKDDPREFLNSVHYSSDTGMYAASNALVAVITDRVDTHELNHDTSLESYSRIDCIMSSISGNRKIDATCISIDMQNFKECLSLAKARLKGSKGKERKAKMQEITFEFSGAYLRYDVALRAYEFLVVHPDCDIYRVGRGDLFFSTADNCRCLCMRFIPSEGFTYTVKG